MMKSLVLAHLCRVYGLAPIYLTKLLKPYDPRRAILALNSSLL